MDLSNSFRFLNNRLIIIRKDNVAVESYFTPFGPSMLLIVES